MAENIIKDFVKKQTTTITIGTPKARPAVQEKPSQTPGTTPVPEPVHSETAVQNLQKTPVRGKVGRPKSEIEKVKMSVYVPAEVKAKLIKLQHMTYKQSINDVFIEGIYMLLTKYDL